MKNKCLPRLILITAFLPFWASAQPSTDCLKFVGEGSIQCNEQLANGHFLIYKSPPFGKDSFEIDEFDEKGNLLETTKHVLPPVFLVKTKLGGQLYYIEKTVGSTIIDTLPPALTSKFDVTAIDRKLDPATGWWAGGRFKSNMDSIVLLDLDADFGLLSRKTLGYRKFYPYYFSDNRVTQVLSTAFGPILIYAFDGPYGTLYSDIFLHQTLIKKQEPLVNGRLERLPCSDERFLKRVHWESSSASSQGSSYQSRTDEFAQIQFNGAVFDTSQSIRTKFEFFQTTTWPPMPPATIYWSKSTFLSRRKTSDGRILELDFHSDSAFVRFQKKLGATVERSENLPKFCEGGHAFEKADSSLVVWIEKSDSIFFYRHDCLAPTTFCPTNLLKNADFENDQTNWQGSGGAISTDAATVFSGSKSLEICSAGQSIRQNVAAFEGKNYRLESQIQTSAAGDEAVLAFKFLDKNWQILSLETAKKASTATFSDLFLEKTAPSGAAWLELSVEKTGAAGCAFFDRFCLTDGSTGQPDLELSASSATVAGPIWTNFSVKFTLKNAGTADEPDARVRLAAPVGMIYEGGNEATATQGTFDSWQNEWLVGPLGAGKSADLELHFFKTTTADVPVFAQVWAQTFVDLDSKPANNSSQTPAEDDEAVVLVNAFRVDPPVFERGKMDAQASDFAIFPNPTTGQTRLFLPLFLGEKMAVEVVDLAGRRVFFQPIEKLENGFFDLDLTAENAGLFFVKIQPENERAVVKRLIISKL